MEDTMTNGWFYKAVTLTANFKPEDFVDNAKHMKLKVVGGNVEFSFSGKESDGKLIDADGMQNFQDINKGKIFLKGTGVATIMAWDGA